MRVQLPSPASKHKPPVWTNPRSGRLRFSFSFPKELNVGYVADVLEAGFYELSGFFDASGGFADIVIIFEGYELRVDERVLDVLVAEQSHDVEDVLCFVVFHCGFPMPKGVEEGLRFVIVSQLKIAPFLKRSYVP